MVNAKIVAAGLVCTAILAAGLGGYYASNKAAESSGEEVPEMNGENLMKVCEGIPHTDENSDMECVYFGCVELSKELTKRDWNLDTELDCPDTPGKTFTVMEAIMGAENLDEVERYDMGMAEACKATRRLDGTLEGFDQDRKPFDWVHERVELNRALRESGMELKKGLYFEDLPEAQKNEAVKRVKAKQEGRSLASMVEDARNTRGESQDPAHGRQLWGHAHIPFPVPMNPVYCIGQRYGCCSNNIVRRVFSGMLGIAADDAKCLRDSGSYGRVDSELNGHTAQQLSNCCYKHDTCLYEENTCAGGGCSSSVRGNCDSALASCAWHSDCGWPFDRHWSHCATAKTLVWGLMSTGPNRNSNCKAENCNANTEAACCQYP